MVPKTCHNQIFQICHPGWVVEYIKVLGTAMECLNPLHLRCGQMANIIMVEGVSMSIQVTIQVYLMKRRATTLKTTRDQSRQDL